MIEMPAAPDALTHLILSLPQFRGLWFQVRSTRKMVFTAMHRSTQSCVIADPEF